MSACCSPPWTFSITAMMCTSPRTAYRASTGTRSLWPSNGCAKLLHRSRLVRACCSSCKVLTLRPIISMRGTKSERHPVDGPCPNFKGIANVVKAEKETTTQRCRRSCLLGIRFYKHNILLIIWRFCITYHIDK